ncbi:MAG TPA: hypothetical protein VF881_21650 [Polyangiaceae bacterium]
MRGALLSLALCVAALGCKKKPPPPPDILPGPPAAKLDLPPRCTPVSAEPPFVLGPSDIARPPSATAEEAGTPERDESLPFASEVGDGITWSGGFAVGAIHERESSLALSVVTLGRDGRNAKVIPLGVAHGDVDPPRLAARGSTLVAGVLEPEPNGRSLRLAKLDDGKVTWGATLQEKTGESQAFDIALGEKKGIVVWDEDGPTSGVIQVSTFDVANVSNATTPRAISPPSVDAESPRLLPRGGAGYWLAYIARSAGGEDHDAQYVPEEIGFRWIEIVPLDGNGSPTTAPRAATPKDGHVMVFDIAPAPEGEALLVWRYDDSPTGSAGGEVMRTVVHSAHIDAPSVLVQGDVGAGVPGVLDGWVAVMDAAERTRLAPISPAGELTAPLSAEPEIGAGEPLAGGSEGLLVARPAGRAVKLMVLKCAPGAP